MEHRISPNTRRSFQDESDKTSNDFPNVACPTGNEFEDSLSFLSVKSAMGVYPDTGESGDAYNVEALNDQKRRSTS
jgi:hypothetical protein